MSLIEDFFDAVSYALNNNDDWWEQFDDINEARLAAGAAFSAEPDEGRLVSLMTLTDTEFTSNPQQTYHLCMRKIIRQLPKD